MSKYIDELIAAIDHIVGNTWYDTTRIGNTGIGKTFEDLLEKEEDNFDAPDFHDIEIKTHETASKSMITLFTKSPSYPKLANTYLRENFGKIDEFGNKILHTTISASRTTNSSEYIYDFSIYVDKVSQIVRILIYDKNGSLVNSDVFWSFESIEQQLSKKLKYIAIVSAKSRIFSGIKQYRYTQVDLVADLTIDGLINAIETGALKIDIRIGAYKTGKNKGKTHDHGTGFRINLLDLMKYSIVTRIR